MKTIEDLNSLINIEMSKIEALIKELVFIVTNKNVIREQKA